MKELPVYQCHKLVRAAQITAVEPSKMLHVVLHLNGGFEVEVNNDWTHKHSPRIGGYFVVYDDGYTSFSPCKAFEQGYDLWKPPAALPAIDLVELKRLCVENGMDQDIADMAFDDAPEKRKTDD